MKIKKKINFEKISIIIFIIGILSLIFFRPITTYDYWWHTKVGEYIVSNKFIPKIGIYSWYALSKNFYWMSHEWLSEVVLYLCSKVGLIGAYLFTLINLTFLMFFLFKKNDKLMIHNNVYTFIWGIIGFAIFYSIAVPRPHMISFNLLAFTIYIILKFKEDENYKYIWLIPIISLLWSNFHGGSSNLPYVLCFMVLITGLFQFETKRIIFKKLSSKQIKTLLIIIFLSIIAITINPHGLKMITYPYTNMTDSTMLNAISEWKSPDIKIFSELFIFIEIFFILFILFINNEAIDFTDLSFLMAFIYLSLKSIRFSALLYIVATFIVFKYIKTFNLNKKIKNYIFKLMISLGCSFFIFYLICVNDIIKMPITEGINPKIIQTIKNENPQRLYNDYSLGCYLIYNDIDVFIDGRADMYSKYSLKDALDLDKLNRNPEKIIKKYNFDLFVIKTNTALYQYLKNSDKYKLLIEDKKNKIVVYKPVKYIKSSIIVD